MLLDQALGVYVLSFVGSIQKLQTPGAVRELQLFEAVNARLASDPPGVAATRDLYDVILNAGGPVWSMAWCPSQPDASGAAPVLEYLAVSSSPLCSLHRKQPDPAEIVRLPLACLLDNAQCLSPEYNLRHGPSADLPLTRCVRQGCGILGQTQKIAPSDVALGPCLFFIWHRDDLRPLISLESHILPGCGPSQGARVECRWQADIRPRPGADLGCAMQTRQWPVQGPTALHAPGSVP